MDSSDEIPDVVDEEEGMGLESERDQDQDQVASEEESDANGYSDDEFEDEEPSPLKRKKKSESPVHLKVHLNNTNQESFDEEYSATYEEESVSPVASTQRAKSTSAPAPASASPFKAKQNVAALLEASTKATHLNESVRVLFDNERLRETNAQLQKSLQQMQSDAKFRHERHYAELRLKREKSQLKHRRALERRTKHEEELIQGRKMVAQYEQDYRRMEQRANQQTLEVNQLLERLTRVEQEKVKTEDRNMKLSEQLQEALTQIKDMHVELQKAVQKQTEAERATQQLQTQQEMHTQVLMHKHELDVQALKEALHQEKQERQLEQDQLPKSYERTVENEKEKYAILTRKIQEEQTKLEDFIHAQQETLKQERELLNTEKNGLEERYQEKWRHAQYNMEKERQQFLEEKQAFYEKMATEQGQLTLEKTRMESMRTEVEALKYEVMEERLELKAKEKYLVGAQDRVEAEAQAISLEKQSVLAMSSQTMLESDRLHSEWKKYQDLLVEHARLQQRLQTLEKEREAMQANEANKWQQLMAKEKEVERWTTALHLERMEQHAKKMQLHRSLNGVKKLEYLMGQQVNMMQVHPSLFASSPTIGNNSMGPQRPRSFPQRSEEPLLPQASLASFPILDFSNFNSTQQLCFRPSTAKAKVATAKAKATSSFGLPPAFSFASASSPKSSNFLLRAEPQKQQDKQRKDERVGPLNNKSSTLSSSSNSNYYSNGNGNASSSPLYMAQQSSKLHDWLSSNLISTN